MAVLFDFQRLWPLFLDGIAQTVQGTNARVATPGKDQLSCTTGTDQLVVHQIRRHPHQSQVFLALTDDFMTRCSRDQVGETFKGNGVTIAHKLFHRVV